MKYKKHIATGALAISLLVGGSYNVFAVTPQDLGIKNTQQTYQKQNKHVKNLKTKNKRKNNVIGTIGATNDAGFILEIKNLKAKTASSIEVKTGTETIYRKNGFNVKASDLIVGQKVIVIGDLDKATNILLAKTVKIVFQPKLKN